MERLTCRSPKFNNPVSNGACKDITCFGKCDSCKINDLIAKLCAYEDAGLEPEDVRRLQKDWTSLIITIDEMGCMPHLRELYEAEKEGRLVVLPCKVGDHVWADGREAIVVWFFGYETERYLHAQFYDNMQYIDIPFTEIGKTVFLTREEAEAAMALKGGEG